MMETTRTSKAAVAQIESPPQGEGDCSNIGIVCLRLSNRKKAAEQGKPGLAAFLRFSVLAKSNEAISAYRLLGHALPPTMDC